MATASTRLNHNDLYFFRYKAKGAETGKLHAYDKAPLVIFLSIGRGHHIGINLHWIPRGQRRAFLDTVLKVSKKVGKGSRRRIVPRIYYETVKTHPQLRKIALFALRSYLTPRMSNVQRIPVEFWDKVLGNPRYRSRKAYKRKGYKN